MGTDLSKSKNTPSKETPTTPKHSQPQGQAKTSKSAIDLYCPMCFSAITPDSKFCGHCGGKLAPKSLLKEPPTTTQGLCTSSRDILARAALHKPDGSSNPPAPKSACKPVTPLVNIVPRSFGELIALLIIGVILIFLTYLFAYACAPFPAASSATSPQDDVAMTESVNSSATEPEPSTSEPGLSEPEQSKEVASQTIPGQYSDEYPWRELYSDFIDGGYQYYSYDKDSRQAQYFAQFLPCLNQDSLGQDGVDSNPLDKYCLYDLDLNGTPELFMKYGTGEPVYVIHIFTVNSSGMVSLGEVNGFHTSLCGLQGVGVLTNMCHMGYEHLGLVTLKGTDLENQEIAKFDFNEAMREGWGDFLKLDSLPYFEFGNTSGLNQTSNPSDNNRALLEENNVQLP